MSVCELCQLADTKGKDMVNYVCPVCREALLREGKRYVCANNHSYDIARSGYVNLLTRGGSIHGDTREMLRARIEIMAEGYYESLVQAVFSALSDIRTPSSVLDAGCGEGYMAGQLSAHYERAAVFGTDISKDAVELAAKHYRDCNFAVAGSNALPFADGSMDMVFTAFAPVFPVEVYRVLAHDGIFVHIQPAARHLFDLKEALYDSVYENPVTELLSEFTLHSEFDVHGEFSVKGKNPANLIMMTPYYWRTPRARLQELMSAEELTAHTEFLVRIYAKA